MNKSLLEFSRSGHDEEARVSCVGALKALAQCIGGIAPEEVTPEVLQGWAAKLKDIAQHVAAHKPTHHHHHNSNSNNNSSDAVTHRSTPTKGAKAAPQRRLSMTMDRVRGDDGHGGVRAARVPSPLLPNLGLCILSVMEAIQQSVPCSTLSLLTPYRGLSDEFLCICKLSRHQSSTFSGSALVRGSNTLEYVCRQSGYLINAGPRVILMAESASNAKLHSFLELMSDPATTSAATATTSAAKAASSSSTTTERRRGAAHARMCCPLKTTMSAASPASIIGVLTLLSDSEHAFLKEHENFVYHAGTVLASLLQRCDDYSALQECFSRGELREWLPPCATSSPSSLLDYPEQLVYRTTWSGTESAGVLRVPNEAGKIEVLGDGSPLMHVFRYMEKLQHAWSAAVRLNVELKQICDEKDAYVSSLVARDRLMYKENRL